MIVTIPNNLNSSTMHHILSSAITPDLIPVDNEIIFDFSFLQFIEPVGVTILGNLVQWLLKRNVKVTFRYPSNYPAAIKYLDDSNFFQMYTGQKINSSATQRNTTIPLQLVAYQDSYQWMDNKLVTWLASRLNLTRASLGDIKVCFQEIFNNINDHSKEHIGCFFAQHYPAKNEVNIAISDFGIGIPSNVQSVIPGLTDSLAIQKATEQGFSTKSTPGNRGAGLDVLVKNVVKNNQGWVYIHSNHGILKCNLGQNNDIVMEPSDIRGFYPGTLFEIVLRTDTIEHVEEEEFEW
ncbi:ATP-binding protein [Brevibacillus agri]|uniref:ATP-binding protein n=1 Tax=Brevibacillus agri TaxID=51101 RepID=UPI001C8D26DE|nr:ATP-binding protein [Brevibacillus agri]MBY0055006.1 ATP-binding protein [Brevibacillus agri]